MTEHVNEYDNLDLSGLTLDEVRVELFAVVAEYGPAHVAPRYNSGCRYFDHPGDVADNNDVVPAGDGPRPSCLIGVWLATKHGATHDQINHHGSVGGDLSDRLKVSAEVRGYLVVVQTTQDDDSQWGLALATAEVWLASRHNRLGIISRNRLKDYVVQF